MKKYEISNLIAEIEMVYGKRGTVNGTHKPEEFLLGVTGSQMIEAQTRDNIINIIEKNALLQNYERV